MRRKCKHPWLNTYLHYTSVHESPDEFHLWIGMSLIAMCLGRRVWMPRGYYTLYPNLYIIIIAQSALCRKSIALDIGKTILKAIENTPPIITTKATPSSMIEQLGNSDDASLIIYASELTVFLSRDAIASGIIDNLTDLYDCPSDWSYGTRERGSEVIDFPCLNIIAGTTPRGLSDMLPIGSIGAGFTSRINFVSRGPSHNRNAFPEVTEEMLALSKDLVADLNTIRALSGEIKIDAEARAWFKQWYNSYKIDPNESLQGYGGRRHDTLLKLGMILSVSDSDDLIVKKNHLLKADVILRRNEHFLPQVLASIEETPEGKDANKIYNLIRAHGRITRTDLLRKVWRNVDSVTMTHIIDTLVKSGFVVRESEGRAIVYKITKLGRQ